MELNDIRPDAADGGEEFGVGRLVCGVELVVRDPERLGGQFGTIESAGVVEHGVEAVAGDIVADSLDHVLRCEGFAEEFDGPCAAGLRDDITLGAELCSELVDQPDGISVGRIEGGDVERHRFRPGESCAAEGYPSGSSKG